MQCRGNSHKTDCQRDQLAARFSVTVQSAQSVDQPWRNVVSVQCDPDRVCRKLPASEMQAQC